MKILSSFTHPHVVHLRSFSFLSLAEATAAEPPRQPGVGVEKARRGQKVLKG